MSKFVLFAVVLLPVSPAQAASKIYCAFQDAVPNGGNHSSSYITHYDVGGTLNPDGSIDLGERRFDYGMSNINGKWQIDLAKKSPVVVDYRLVKFVAVNKSKNGEWTTFVPKVPFGDGAIAQLNLTISNRNLTPEPQYQASYKAIYGYTLLGDDSNARVRVYGTCTYSK